MATAKLWWTGSAWTTTASTFWRNVTKGGPQGNDLEVRNQVSIVAYDDFTIKLGQTNTPYQTGSIYWDVSFSYDQIKVSSGSTTLATGSVYGVDVTDYTSFSMSGSCQVVGMAGSTPYGSGVITFSSSETKGSTTISTPWYTVSYNVNGGSGSISSTRGVKNYASTLTSSKPTRTGYTFAGWNTNSAGTGTTYASGGTLPAQTGNITLYATWTINNYNVSISAGEGTTITFDGTAYTNTTTTVAKQYNKSCAYTITANSGWILKTASPATSGTITIPANNNTALSSTGQRVGCRVYNGSAWKQANIYVYNGSQWKMCQAYVFDGSQWKLLN